MTAQTAALDALIAAVDAGDESWVHLPRIPELHTDLVWKAWSGSLDAALALHNAVLPGWVAKLSAGGEGAGVTKWHCTVEDWNEGTEFHGDNQPSTARAWLLAILRAIKSQVKYD